MKVIDLMIVVVTVVLMLLLLLALIPLGSGGLDTPLDRISTYSNCIWIEENGEFAFIADENAEIYGLGSNSDEILHFRLGRYSDELMGHQFKIFATGENQLSDARKVTNRRWNKKSQVLLLKGSALSIGPKDDIIEVKTEEKTIRFEKYELSKGFSFDETPVWPEEMLRWLEQCELST